MQQFSYCCIDKTRGKMVLFWRKLKARLLLVILTELPETHPASQAIGPPPPRDWDENRQLRARRPLTVHKLLPERAAEEKARTTLSPADLL
jgi:hypothetical protein